jgi:3-hydroxyisobutyrate dehydrogenase
MSAVAVLGSGAMGTGMALNLAEDGHEVTVWNRTPARAQRLADQLHGATAAASPRVAATGADLVIVMVTDDEASHRVWLDDVDGALAGLRPGAIAVESSTISPTWAVELGTRMTDLGHRFLEAPVVGSRPQLAARQLLYLTGGDEAILDAARPVLDVNANAVHHLGPVGNAATMKLAINGLLAIQVAAFSEIIGLLDRSALDRDTALDLVGELPLTSPALRRIVGLIGSDDFDPNFTIDLVAKDLGYLNRTATDLQARTPLSAVTRELFSQANRDGRGREDIASLARLYIDP